MLRSSIALPRLASSKGKAKNTRHWTGVFDGAVRRQVETEQQKYMKAALRLAQKAAEEGEVPVGAVVVCEGKIVGRGRNRRETKKNALHHAEIEAIEKACRKLGGWRLQ